MTSLLVLSLHLCTEHMAGSIKNTPLHNIYYINIKIACFSRDTMYLIRYLVLNIYIYIYLKSYIRVIYVMVLGS